jgi:WD40 repeat protein
MSLCLNPQCTHQQNAPHHRFCVGCGSSLRLGDRYIALEELSTGGQGRTFRGQDCLAPDDASACLLKQIAERDPDKVRSVVDQLRPWGEHPQLPRILDYFETAPAIANFRPTLIQDFITGTPIDQGPGTVAQVVQFLDDLLPLLQALHDQGLIHRDINPQNLRRQPDGTLMLLDFSAATVTRKTALATTGTVVGSAAYLAPEQLRGHAIPASDLYSVGLVGIHLLTGVQPFDLISGLGGLPRWTDYLIQAEDEQSVTLVAVLTRLVAEAPSDRFPSAAAAYAALHAGQTLPPATLPAPDAVTTRPGWHCRQTLTTAGAVKAIAVHPLLPQILSGGADCRVRSWFLDADTLNPIAQDFSGHRSIVTTVQYVPQTEQWLSGSWDYTVRCWEGGETVAVHQLHTGWVTALVVWPDGKQVASGGADQVIQAWERETGTILHTLTGHGGAIASMQLSPATQTLASGSADRTIKLWDSHTGTLRHTLTGHEDTVTALGFSPSGQLLYSGSLDGTIRVWWVQDGQAMQTWKSGEAGVSAIALHPQGNLCVSGHPDGRLTLWHPGRGSSLQTLTGHSGAVNAIAFHPRERWLVTGSEDQTIQVWVFGESD